MKTHLVTGAGSGIGAAVATRLLDRGDRLILVARSRSRAEELSQRFEAVKVLIADLADPGTINGLGREIEGDVDSLVHVAGVVELAPVERIRQAQLQEQLAVNLISPAILTREFLPGLRRSRGTVVFVNSTAGLSASAQWSAYAASKFGLRALADSLRAEESSHGVKVTTIFPGRTATPMQEKVHAQEGKVYEAEAWLRPESVADTIVHVLDLPLSATIEEITMRPGGQVVSRATS